MTPNARFQEFLKDIEPSSTTKSNASSAHTRLRSTLEHDEDFRPFHRHTFLSGSYKRDTAIRPRVKNGNAERPDIDIIVVTMHNTYDNPVSVVDAVHRRVDTALHADEPPGPVGLGVIGAGRHGRSAANRSLR